MNAQQTRTVWETITRAILGNEGPNVHATLRAARQAVHAELSDAVDPEDRRRLDEAEDTILGALVKMGEPDRQDGFEQWAIRLAMSTTQERHSIEWALRALDTGCDVVPWSARSVVAEAARITKQRAGEYEVEWNVALPGSRFSRRVRVVVRRVGARWAVDVGEVRVRRRTMRDAVDRAAEAVAMVGSVAFHTPTTDGPAPAPAPEPAPDGGAPVRPSQAAHEDPEPEDRGTCGTCGNLGDLDAQGACATCRPIRECETCGGEALTVRRGEVLCGPCAGWTECEGCDEHKPDVRHRPGPKSFLCDGCHQDWSLTVDNQGEQDEPGPSDRDEAQADRRKGWRRWCRWGVIEDCESEAERQGFRAASARNESSGLRPSSDDAAGVYPFEGEGPTCDGLRCGLTDPHHVGRGCRDPGHAEGCPCHECDDVHDEPECGCSGPDEECTPECVAMADDEPDELTDDQVREWEEAGRRAEEFMAAQPVDPVRALERDLEWAEYEPEQRPARRRRDDT